MKGRRRSDDEWAELRQQFESSGLSMKAFAESEGLSTQYFARKLKQLLGDAKPSAFVRITPPTAAATLVIQLGDVRIHCTESVSPRWIASVAAALRA